MPDTDRADTFAASFEEELHEARRDAEDLHEESARVAAVDAYLRARHGAAPALPAVELPADIAALLPEELTALSHEPRAAASGPRSGYEWYIYLAAPGIYKRAAEAAARVAGAEAKTLAAAGVWIEADAEARRLYPDADTSLHGPAAQE